MNINIIVTTLYIHNSLDFFLNVILEKYIIGDVFIARKLKKKNKQEFQLNYKVKVNDTLIINL